MKRCHRIGASIGRLPRKPQARTAPAHLTATKWKQLRKPLSRPATIGEWD